MSSKPPSQLRLMSLFQSPFVRDTGRVFLMKAAQLVLGFIVTVILARLLGADGYGIYSFAYALTMLLALPAEAGLPALLVRETARGEADRAPDRVKQVWNWSARMVGSASVLVVLIAGPALVYWQGGLDEVAGRTIAWALVLTPLIVLSNTAGAALRGLKRISAGQIAEFILRPGFFLLLLVSGAGLWGVGALSPDSSMALHALAALLATTACLWLLWRLTPVGIRSASPSGQTKGLMSSMLLFALLAGFQLINMYADIVILGLFEPSDQVGIYRVAVQVGTLAAVGLHVVNIVVAPRFADLHLRGQMGPLQRLVTTGSRFTLGVSALITTTFLVLGSGLLGFIFGVEYAAAFSPLVILLIGQLVHSSMGSVGNLLNMTGLESRTAAAMALAAGINIALNLILIPIWGLVGAATATAVATTVWNVVLWVRVKRDLGINTFALGVSPQ